MSRENQESIRGEEDERDAAYRRSLEGMSLEQLLEEKDRLEAQNQSMVQYYGEGGVHDNPWPEPAQSEIVDNRNSLSIIEEVMAAKRRQES